MAITHKEQLLVLLNKALDAKKSGKTLSDLIREAYPLEVGEQDVHGIVEFSLHAKIGEDYETDRYKGVALDEVLTWVMATVPGFMEDKLRRSAAIVIELKRAENENRDVQQIVWIDDAGQQHDITVQEIKNEQERVTAWKEKAQKTLAPFAKIIKTRVPAKGRVSVSNVQIQVNEIQETPCKKAM